MSEGIKKDEIKIEPENGKSKAEAKQEKPTEPPKDFKIAEIWIKNDTVALNAIPEFWMDKLRARGILDYCDDIVRDSTQEKRNRIIPVTKNAMVNFARIIGNKFRRK